jgi:phenylpyruvate tautomerase PptA (4-oxalocrotonate tautomerase family)
MAEASPPTQCVHGSEIALTSVFSKLTNGSERPPPPRRRHLPHLNIGSKGMTMPLWKVYHSAGAYTQEDKHAFSKRITDIYSQVPLPKFYVDVVFEEVPQDSFYVGGEPALNFDFISTRRPSTCGQSRAYDRRVRGPKTRSGGFPKIDPHQERMIERIGRLLVDRMSVIEEAEMSPAPARGR